MGRDYFFFVVRKNLSSCVCAEIQTHVPTNVRRFRRYQLNTEATDSYECTYGNHILYAELGRNPVSKHQIQPEYGDEQADAGRDG